MTIEEKLRHFNDFCIQDAKIRADKNVEEYGKALEKTFAEHQEDERRRADMQIKIEQEELNKRLNRELSLEQLRSKKILGEKRAEIYTKIFSALQKKLESFMHSADYYMLLQKQVQAAIDFAGEDTLDIYISPEDVKHMDKLADLCPKNGKVRLLESKYSFFGGTRAVIPDKNILIDRSFEKKMAEARESFHIHAGGAHA